jgi:hypothetical protein
VAADFDNITANSATVVSDSDGAYNVLFNNSVSTTIQLATANHNNVYSNVVAGGKIVVDDRIRLKIHHNQIASGDISVDYDYLSASSTTEFSEYTAGFTNTGHKVNPARGG